VFKIAISLMLEILSLRWAIDCTSLSGAEDGLVSPTKKDRSGLSSWRLMICLFTVEELVVVGGPMSACPTSPSIILVCILRSRQVLARKVESVDFPESTSPRMITSPLDRTRTSTASRQLGGMVDPLTCFQTLCSPVRT
jgi:hypothetical protein